MDLDVADLASGEQTVLCLSGAVLPDPPRPAPPLLASLQSERAPPFSLLLTTAPLRAHIFSYAALLKKTYKSFDNLIFENVLVYLCFCAFLLR